uniref:aspartate aminotransferase family protein n=1 Tax=Komagataeibacter kakiaceti TaxID=943261 RepID=UPI00047142DC
MTDTNATLLARRDHAVARGVATATPIFTARAENAELWDVEGRRYVDFAGGIAVLNVGHRHPKVIEAVRAQLDRFTHTAFQVSAYEPYIALAERLNALAPFAGPAKTVFFSTGGEATENAVKIARAATGRNGIIAFTGGFHGRTLLASAMTGKVRPYKAPFGTLPGEVYHIPFPDAATSVADSLRMLDFLFAADLPPTSVAAIIIEPVQGEGGFRVAPPELLVALRRLCDEHGIKLVADEVQSGFARTGRMFAIEHSGVQPDLVSVAKSMGGGLPLSGVIGRAELMDAVGP